MIWKQQADRKGLLTPGQHGVLLAPAARNLPTMQGARLPGRHGPTPPDGASALGGPAQPGPSAIQSTSAPQKVARDSNPDMNEMAIQSTTAPPLVSPLHYHSGIQATRI